MKIIRVKRDQKNNKIYHYSSASYGTPDTLTCGGGPNGASRQMAHERRQRDLLDTGENLWKKSKI